MRPGWPRRTRLPWPTASWRMGAPRSGAARPAVALTRGYRCTLCAERPCWRTAGAGRWGLLYTCICCSVLTTICRSQLYRTALELLRRLVGRLCTGRHGHGSGRASEAGRSAVALHACHCVPPCVALQGDPGCSCDVRAHWRGKPARALPCLALSSARTPRGSRCMNPVRAQSTR